MNDSQLRGLWLDLDTSLSLWIGKSASAAVQTTDVNPSKKCPFSYACIRTIFWQCIWNICTVHHELGLRPKLQVGYIPMFTVEVCCKIVTTIYKLLATYISTVCCKGSNQAVLNTFRTVWRQGCGGYWAQDWSSRSEWIWFVKENWAGTPDAKKIAIKGSPPQKRYKKKI